MTCGASFASARFPPCPLYAPTVMIPIVRALERVRGEIAQALLQARRRPHEEHAEVLLAGRGALHRIRTIERAAAGARLQCLEPRRDFALADPCANCLRAVEIDVGVVVAKHERVLAATELRREFGLNADVDAIADSGGEDEPRPSQEEATILADRPVTRRTLELLVRLEQSIVAELRVPADGQAVIPRSYGGGRVLRACDCGKRIEREYGARGTGEKGAHRWERKMNVNARVVGAWSAERSLATARA